MYEVEQSATLPKLSDDLGKAVKKFSTHDLSGIANSELMDRVDSKFLLPINSITDILEACSDYYSALMINGVSVFQYDNIYFDTPNLNFYRNHHNRKLNRHKVRHRHYADVGTSFLEVKFKNNKGRTIKNRCQADKDYSVALTSNYPLLTENGINTAHLLIPSQQVCYQRISLANDLRKERLTIDVGINFTNALENSDHNNTYNLSNFYVAELKQEKLDRQSPFYIMMRKMGIRPKGFSKYCMGVSLTNNKQMKTNRFKANIIRLNRGA